MLKSNNFNSIIDDLSAFSQADSFEGLRPTTLDLETGESTQQTTTTPENSASLQFLSNNNINNNEKPPASATTSTSLLSEPPASLASLQLTAGFMQSFSPPLVKARGQLKELIGKQNKIYIDLSTEKCKLDNAEVAKLHEMMNDVKLYREKLLKIKKQMQNIYQRTKVLKKRALNIQTCKEKELQRKLQKQQQEESLIGKQQQQQQQQPQ